MYRALKPTNEPPEPPFALRTVSAPCRVNLCSNYNRDGFKSSANIRKNLSSSREERKFCVKGILVCKFNFLND